MITGRFPSTSSFTIFVVWTMQATLNRLHQIDFQSTSPTLWTTVWRCFRDEQILANRIIPALHLVPECGRTFQENSASFTSPSYYSLVPPSEPERCEWRITATHGERIVLNITDLVTYPIAVWFVGKRELDFFICTLLPINRRRRRSSNVIYIQSIQILRCTSGFVFRSIIRLRLLGGFVVDYHCKGELYCRCHLYWSLK